MRSIKEMIHKLISKVGHFSIFLHRNVFIIYKNTYHLLPGTSNEYFSVSTAKVFCITYQPVVLCIKFDFNSLNQYIDILLLIYYINIDN